MAEVGKVKLNTGASLPAIGYGTWQIIFNVRKKVMAAIELGYRLIDTAKIYGNEVGVGAAIRDCGVDREEIFLTTKLWNSDQGYESALAACDESLQRLGLEYIDLYLIHWPSHDPSRRRQSWLALQDLYRRGQAKAIGVSNFNIDQLVELLSYAEVKPAVNQIEFHPYIYRRQLPTLEYCQQHKIVVEAYSPLAHGRHRTDPLIAQIAAKHGASSAQIMLAWCLHHGTVPIPKSTSLDRMKENIESVSIKLTEADVKAINNLSRDESVIGRH
ncbi:MAG: aldo/keto reductase [Candidatus Saccharimonadales bacterium]